MSLYIDGSEVDSKNTNKELNSLSNIVYLGFYESSFETFNGTIDEARLWNRSLTKHEIKELYESKVTYPTQTNFSLSESNTGDSDVYYDFYRNGTVASIWHFDEGSGNYTFDETGNNNTGTLRVGPF